MLKEYSGNGSVQATFGIFYFLRFCSVRLYFYVWEITTGLELLLSPPESLPTGSDGEQCSLTIVAPPLLLKSLFPSGIS